MDSLRFILAPLIWLWSLGSLAVGMVFALPDVFRYMKMKNM